MTPKFEIRKLKLGCLIIVATIFMHGITDLALGQDRTPQIGVVYPAGGQCGRTFIVMVSGQFLRPADSVDVSGEGVSAEVIGKCFVPNNINREQQYMIASAMWNAMESALRSSGVSKQKIADYEKELRKKHPFKLLHDKTIEVKGEKMPQLPLLFDLDGKSPKEIIHAKEVIFRPRKYRQKNRQLAESVVLKVTVSPDAQPGIRLLRLFDKFGNASNQMIFIISEDTEVLDSEPNDIPSFEKQQPVILDSLQAEAEELPFVMNGRILPGDVDCFRFKAQKGQKVIVDVNARLLIPYLADAVPGWFQPVVTVYDSQGKRIAYADDHLFSPDPIVFFEAPATAEYEVEIRDSIYRGREDFVYRVCVKDGAGLEDEFVSGSTYGDIWSRRAVTPAGLSLEKLIPEDVESLPSVDEKRNNSAIANAQSVKMPILINGLIEEPGDTDIYKINIEQAGDIAVELYGRRLGSPIDSFVKVTDKKGNVIASNDDYSPKEKHLHLDPYGIITHMADSRLVASAPEKGEYYVHVSDVTASGGSKYGYRLRISEPMPGFTVRVTPSLASLRWRDSTLLTAYVERRDGYDGPISLKVMEPAEGFALHGGDIPDTVNSWVMTLGAESRGDGEPLNVRIAAEANVNDEKLTSPVMSADRVMQAFLFEHLVPTGELKCVVRKEKWGVPVCERLDDSEILLTPGATASVVYKTPWKGNKNMALELVLEHAPEGIDVEPKLKLENGQILVGLKAAENMKPYRGNIVVSVWDTGERKGKDGKKRANRWRVRTLPAIPIVVKSDETSVALAE